MYVRVINVNCPKIRLKLKMRNDIEYGMAQNGFLCADVSLRNWRLCDSVTLTFDLLTQYSLMCEVSLWTIALCKVWRFWFKPFWFYRADRQTDRQTDRIADADDRYTDATGVSNYSVLT